MPYLLVAKQNFGILLSGHQEEELYIAHNFLICYITICYSRHIAGHTACVLYNSTVILEMLFMLDPRVSSANV